MKRIMDAAFNVPWCPSPELNRRMFLSGFVVPCLAEPCRALPSRATPGLAKPRLAEPCLAPPGHDGHRIMPTWSWRESNPRPSLPLSSQKARGQTNFQDLVFVSALAVPTLRIAFTERFQRLGLVMAVHLSADCWQVSKYH